MKLNTILARLIIILLKILGHILILKLSMYYLQSATSKFWQGDNLIYILLAITLATAAIRGLFMGAKTALNWMASFAFQEWTFGINGGRAQIVKKHRYCWK